MFTCITLVLWAAAAGTSAQELPWWKTAVFYQVYPRSFRDSNGDGLGDLTGIAQSAEYFRDIGVDAIWISPFYQSPMVDFGYDISNYTEVDPIFGTMDDFDSLVARLKNVGVKLLLDFVPNHSSDQHPWFQSSSNTSDPHHNDYKDFYVWKDPIGWYNETTPIPPNNWFSIFAGGAWQWNDDRKQFYLHQFKIQQPDLNLRNPLVIGNLTEIFNFWLDKGVDGFRMDAVPFLYENSSYPDDPPVPGTNGSTYVELQHVYENNQPETFELLNKFADVLDRRRAEDGKQRVMLLEVYQSIETDMEYYGAGNHTFMFPFDYALMALNEASRSFWVKLAVDFWLSKMPAEGSANWMIGNHDLPRVATRCGTEMVDTMNMLTMVMPGSKVTYYGEEIGMEDTYVRPDQTQDHTRFHTDVSRTPLQWNDNVSAGFSTNSSTWLPVNPNYWRLNVAAQMSAESSHLKVFKAMAQARKDIVLQRGDLELLTPDNDTLVVVRRYNDSFVVLISNVGSEVKFYTTQNLFGPNKLDTNMIVVVESINSVYGTGTMLKQGSLNVTLRPKASVLLKSNNSTSTSATTQVPLLGSLLLLLVSLLSR